MTLFQFKVAYQLSEITEDIKNKLLVAISKALGLDKSTLFLSFAEADMNRRAAVQKGVLATVSLVNHGSPTTSLLSLITEDSINSQMSAQGLKSVQLVNVGSSSTSTISTTAMSSSNTSGG